MVARFILIGASQSPMSSPVVPISPSPPEVPIPQSAKEQRVRFAAAYSILQRAIEGRAFPGAAFSVLSNNEIVAIDGLGNMTYEQSSAGITSSTIFDLASITKVLATTSMAMLLYQRGQLPLDQPIVDWLPAFANEEGPDSARRRVTPRMLLAHSSGLPGYARLFESCSDADALFQACLRLPLAAPPGARAEYSDMGFILLGRLLEKIAGEPIDSFCRREIFTPLGMSSTCFLPPASWSSFIAPTEEDLTFRHRVLQGEVQDENCFVLGGVSGHAGLFSNAMDPLRYAQCLLGQICGESLQWQLFVPETIELFTSRAEMPPGSSRALGWDTPSSPSSSGLFLSPHSIGHLGYAGTSFWIDLERQTAIVLLTNRTWPHRENEVIRSVRPAFHDAIIQAI